MAIDKESQSEIRTITEFVDYVRNYPLQNVNMLWRGQAKKGNLLPGVARSDAKKNTEAKEREALDQIKLLGASLLPQAHSSDLDLLVLAQHFGLKTRLLDWTTNPLMALWFACADSIEGDAYVYGLIVVSELLAKDTYASDPLKGVNTRVFQPRLNNPRLIAQHGWFTLHKYSLSAKRFVPLEAHRTLSKHIVELRIPKESRPQILTALDAFGINVRTVYPDLSGLCSYLNQKLTL